MPPSSEITSCDLPTPHYHFAAREVKWISRDVLVARPVVLYVRDVPILWLPFIFQDMRPGRRSGILIPQFGINDLVRPSRLLQPPDHQRRLLLGAERLPRPHRPAGLVLQPVRPVRRGRPVPLAQPLPERRSVAYSNQQRERAEARRSALRWDHRQTFDLTTSLNLNLNYASNTPVIRAERDRSAAEHPADHQLAQLLASGSAGAR